MKAFIAKSVYRYSREKDILILAKTKLDATMEFKLLKEREGIYKTMDFKEVELENIEVYAMDITGRNYEHHKDSDTPRYYCFEPRYQVRLKVHRFFDPDQIVLAETEATYTHIVETFKQQNKEMLLELF